MQGKQLGTRKKVCKKGSEQIGKCVRKKVARN